MNCGVGEVVGADSAGTGGVRIDSVRVIPPEAIRPDDRALAVQDHDGGSDGIEDRLGDGLVLVQLTNLTKHSDTQGSRQKHNGPGKQSEMKQLLT